MLIREHEVLEAQCREIVGHSRQSSPTLRGGKGFQPLITDTLGVEVDRPPLPIPSSRGFLGQGSESARLCSTSSKKNDCVSVPSYNALTSTSSPKGTDQMSSLSSLISGASSRAYQHLSSLALEADRLSSGRFQPAATGGTPIAMLSSDRDSSIRGWNSTTSARAYHAKQAGSMRSTGIASGFTRDSNFYRSNAGHKQSGATAGELLMRSDCKTLPLNEGMLLRLSALNRLGLLEGSLAIKLPVNECEVADEDLDFTIQNLWGKFLQMDVANHGHSRAYFKTALCKKKPSYVQIRSD